MNRDFKGVWIPKEIWLSKELTALEKFIFTEIYSLDNEEHCTAGNEYFAEFCNCSQSAVTKTIKHLTELGLIEVISFDGRHRQIRVVNFTMQSSKIYEAESENLLSSNIENNITNNIDNNSKELLTTQRSLLEKPKKKNLYQKCVDLINDYTENEELRTVLRLYLKMRLEIRDKPMYANMWKGLLNKLTTLADSDELACQIVQQSLDRGYLSFFNLSTYTSKKSFVDSSAVKHKGFYEDEDYVKKEEELRDERKRNGQRTEF